MMTQHSRRDILRGGVAAAGLSLVGFPEWPFHVAQGETLVPFTDLPPTLNLTPRPDARLLDVRTIDGPFTPKDQFLTTQHDVGRGERRRWLMGGDTGSSDEQPVRMELSLRLERRHARRAHAGVARH